MLFFWLGTVLYARYPYHLETSDKLDSAHKARNVADWG